MVDAYQLAEVLVVELQVDRQVVYHIVFHAGHDVLSLLDAALHRLALIVGRYVELARAGEEAGEEVDDVVVRAGVKDNLAVEAGGKFEAQVVAHIVFCRQARLEAGLVERGVVDIAQARVEQPVAEVGVVGDVGREGAGVLVLSAVDAVVVGVAVVGGIALDADAVACLVDAYEVGDAQRHIEARDAAELRCAGAVVEGDIVFGVGHGAVH